MASLGEKVIDEEEDIDGMLLKTKRRVFIENITISGNTNLIKSVNKVIDDDYEPVLEMT